GSRLIHLDIRDTGPGISLADQQQIFDWFRQGEHMRAGSGLGLHLSQRIAQLHGGNITVKSRLGQGSTFTLSLPSLS
ncbi:MAG: ATP-binding protein, partial [Cyanobacteria bacterium J06632_22]